MRLLCILIRQGLSGRKKLQKKENRNESTYGHCIDCNQCVQVCPTGIDIRHGTQLECVNCTACIDACDYMMKSINLPPRLIKFASEDNIKNKQPFRLTLRMIGYAVVLVILLGVLVSMVVLRKDIETVVLRLPGQLYTRVEKHHIRNVYTYNIINKTNQDFESLKFQLIDSQGIIHSVPEGRIIQLGKQGQVEGTMFIDLPLNEVSKDNNTLKMEVYNTDQLLETVKFRFLGHIQRGQKSQRELYIFS